jgi:release factor glutamine methyltransferase
MAGQESHAWSIRDLMKSSIDHLQQRGFGEARLSVELLLSHALRCQRIELYTHFDKPLSTDEMAMFRELFRRRLAHEPVQYIVGSTSFMGLQFAVDKRVFIPRPETETLVEQVMLKCGEQAQRGVVDILDIGIGSGNIAVALAKLVRNARIVSLDRSAEALEVATANALKHGVAENVTFEVRNILEPAEIPFSRQFDFLVSNPPYVSIQEWQDLDPEVRLFEPKLAVTDQNDGYEFYHRIGVMAQRIVRKTGWVIVEVGFGQAERVSEIFHDATLAEVSVVNDLQGIPRVVLGMRP